MPFLLKNVGATLHRELEHTLKDLIGKFMEDYQDDMTVQSILRENHINHLRQVF